MRDKGLDIFLMVLFGVGGIVILVLAWTRPMPVPERILTTSIGAIGFFGVLARALFLLFEQGRINLEKDSAEVGVRKKPY